MTPDPDHDAVALAAAGDHDAFASLYRRHVALVRRACTRYVVEFELEDAVQDVWLQVHRSLPSFQHRSLFSSWLYRVALNTAMIRSMRYRRQARRLAQTTCESLDAVGVQPPDRPERGPEIAVEVRDVLSRLVAKINMLPKKQRTAVILGPIQRHQEREITAATGVHSGAHRSALRRARVTLRAAIEVD